MNGHGISHFDGRLTVNNNITLSDMDCSVNESTKKRKLNDDNSTVDTTIYPAFTSGRRFLPVRGNNSVFMTEDWKPSGTSLFLPVIQDLFINADKYEQLSVANGSFFVADEYGNYLKSVKGKVLHMWKYDKSERKLFIARSLLYTCPQEFSILQSLILSL